MRRNEMSCGKKSFNNNNLLSCTFPVKEFKSYIVDDHSPLEVPITDDCFGSFMCKKNMATHTINDQKPSYIRLLIIRTETDRSSHPCNNLV